MPKFFAIPSSEVRAKWVRPGRKPRVRDQYVSYILQVKRNEVGKLVLADEENPSTIQGSLYRAAKSIGVKLQIRRIDNELLFRIQRRNDQP